jgi:hypothetical protein
MRRTRRADDLVQESICVEDSYERSLIEKLEKSRDTAN